MVEELTKDNFKDKISSAKSPVLVDFYADWCGSCKVASEVIDSMLDDFSDIKIYKLNTDEAEDLVTNLGVFSLPTFILFDKGEEVNRLIGICERELIEEMLSAL
jgi:thioredoxin 1